MKAVIRTKDRGHVCGFSRTVTNRENWTATSHNGGLVFEGSGSTLSGRDVDVRVKFDEDGGEAVLWMDAPDSNGGFLATIMEEIIGNSGADIQHTAPGHRPTEVSPDLESLEIEVDGIRVGWTPEPASGEVEETCEIWRWRVSL